ncbi:cathepsin L-like peptidase [Saccoglossus kowalevskii]|uniref:Cathepsin L1-like n=1 Tax=Saccoglossus kowalevskii TaxID=10224 RepID=A0ABM0M0U4_SACKO|nr:PREDICTED: cathepsin L1-like [Saccoglossus kowalevskii]
MKLFICMLFVAMATAFNMEWENYKAEYGKVYNSDEDGVRQMIWSQNKKNVELHNMKYRKGESSYTMEMNQFGDMTNKEFTDMMCGYKGKKQNSPRSSTFLAPSNYKAPDSVDWRTKGYVTEVKDQGACGSCWAFSTTGSMEGQSFKNTGKLVSFSEQQLVDCSGSYGNMGCGGGLMDQAFAYIEDYGIEPEADYPYTAKDDPCSYDTSKAVATNTGYTDIATMDEKALQQAVATVGPISVAIDASHSSFRLYKSGVYDEPACSQTMLDHGVLAVGYGTTDDGNDYWIVKNSWGSTWGNQGYIHMSRNNDNQCGIATNASYPLM